MRKKKGKKNNRKKMIELRLYQKIKYHQQKYQLNPDSMAAESRVAEAGA